MSARDRWQWATVLFCAVAVAHCAIGAHVDPHTTTTGDGGCGAVAYMACGYALALATWSAMRRDGA